jgi:CRP-like cAMP-binding protein
MYVSMPTSPNRPHSPSTSVSTKKGEIPRYLKSGKYLFREGDAAKRIYEVISGVVRLTRVMENGRRQVIAFGYPGDIVGFPCGAEYHTDCDILIDAKVIAHRREALESGNIDPALHSRLLEATLSEISGMQDHFMMLGRKSASEKVASFLCVLADRVGSPVGNYTQLGLPMDRSDIADFLGLTTETVSRTLTQLRKCKVIAIDNIRTVIILKPEALLALAEGDDA